MVIFVGAKIISLFIIFLAVAVLLVSAWILTILNNAKDSVIGPTNNLTMQVSRLDEQQHLLEDFVISMKFSVALQACAYATIIGGVLQLVVSTLVLFSSNVGFKSKLEVWQAVNTVSFFIITSSLLIPVTLDPETNSFLGIQTFTASIGTCLGNLWHELQIMRQQTENQRHNGSIDFFLLDINPYFIILFFDAVFLLLCLLINISALIIHSMYKHYRYSHVSLLSSL